MKTSSSQKMFVPVRQGARLYLRRSKKRETEDEMWDFRCCAHHIRQHASPTESRLKLDTALLLEWLVRLRVPICSGLRSICPITSIIHVWTKYCLRLR